MAPDESGAISREVAWVANRKLLEMFQRAPVLETEIGDIAVTDGSASTGRQDAGAAVLEMGFSHPLWCVTLTDANLRIPDTRCHRF